MDYSFSKQWWFDLSNLSCMVYKMTNKSRFTQSVTTASNVIMFNFGCKFVNKKSLLINSCSVIVYFVACWLISKFQRIFFWRIASAVQADTIISQNIFFLTIRKILMLSSKENIWECVFLKENILKCLFVKFCTIEIFEESILQNS